MKISKDFINIEEKHHMTMDRLKVLCAYAEKMPNGFFVQTDKNELLFANKKMADIYECAGRSEFLEMIEKDELQLVHSDDMDAVGASLRAQLTNNPEAILQAAYRIRTKANNIRWICGYGTMTNVVDYGDVYIMYLVDVTGTRSREISRAELNDFSTAGEPVTTFDISGDADADNLGALNGMRVLIVDDNDLMRELSAELLEEAGAIVTEAADGRKAVELVEGGENYDAILLDIVMPEMDGVEATKEIGSYHRKNHIDIPIIILTSEGSNEQVKTCIRYGAYDYMRKPFSVLDFSRIMLSYLRLQSELYEKRMQDTIESSRRDPLTGVGNSTAYTAKVAEIVEEMNRNQFAEVAVVVCDVNNLKEENDNFGHDSGDTYLRNCCSIISLSFKDSNVYRVGGDEFVVILEGEDYHKAESRMIHLQNAMLAASVIPETKDGKAFFASGLAIYDRRVDRRYSDVVKRADIAMYENKRFLKGIHGRGY